MVPPRCSPHLLHRWPAPAATTHRGGGRLPRPRSTSAWASMADLPNRRRIPSPNSTMATPTLPPTSLLPHTANVLLPTTPIPFFLPWMHLVSLQLQVSTSAANKKRAL
uniref:Uncharacterized protein n=1 Tax=Triticum urartu TaxID=4572 RepID=A0A8R7QZF2_TRIUA